MTITGERAENAIVGGDAGEVQDVDMAPAKEQHDAEVESCGICFEALGGSPLELPCACKVSFCMACWDRSLCESFKTCGQARCPTCRVPVQVDFDADSGSLVFSREVQDAADEEEEEGSGMRARAVRAHRTREKIIEQVRPAQIRNLQRYGATCSLHCCADSEEKKVTPKCVCGASFFKQSVLDRARSYMRRSMPEGNPMLQRPMLFETLVRMNLEAGVVSFTCDVCSRQLEADGNVWTCENDDRTILHAATYDICDHCFDSVTHGYERRLPEPTGPPVTYSPGDFFAS